MHKGFYASGFLYHPRTQRILLQQKNYIDKSSKWCLIGLECQKDVKAEESFRKAIEKILHLKIKPSSVKYIYDYFHEETNKNHYVSYAKVGKLEKFQPSNGSTFAWFSFKEISKLDLSEQTRQDITVGQRVINASIRKNLGERTIE